ncbi:MAG: hypothetical protein R6V85_19065 [Polyangia bacterium]
MKSSLVSLSAALAAALVALGCGGAQEEKTMKDRMLEEEDEGGDLVDNLIGDVQPVEMEEEEEQPAEEPSEKPGVPEEDIIEGTQGALLAKIVVQGEEVDGTLTIKTAEANPVVVEENVPAGAEIRLDPGTYDVVVDTDAVSGNSQLTLRDLEIPSGRRIRREVKYKVGEIKLVTGRRCVKKPIRLKPKGATEWMDEKFKTCVPIILRAGEYEGEMGAGRHGTPISGIKVYDGGKREILIRKQ